MSNHQQVIVNSSLTEEQLNTIDRIKAHFQLKGVLVGALPGKVGNQVYPLLLINRQLYILRLIENLRSEWRGLGQSIEEHAGVLGYTVFATEHDKVWYARPYYQNILLDGQQLFTDWTDAEMQNAIQSLFKNFLAGFKVGLIHGHIWAGNLAVNDKKFILLDYAAGLVDKSTNLESSELQLADIQSLGRVIKELVPLSLLGKLEPVLSTCIVADGDISRIIEQIYIQLNTLDQNKEQTESIAGIKSGRLLPKKASEPVNIVTAPEITPDETVQRARSTSNLSAEVVESIRKAVAEEVAVLEEKLPKSVSNTEKLVQGEKVSEYYNTDRPINVIPNSSSKQSDALVTGIMLIALAVFAWFMYQRFAPEGDDDNLQAKSESEQSISYATYWSSQVPSRMQVVAKEAILGDSEAELTIVQSALKQESLPNVRTDIIRIAFDPRWEHQLLPQDRKLALALGLADLINEPISGLPDLADAHPGVILAVIVNLPITGDVGVAAKLPVRLLATLPGVFKTAIAELEALGVKNFTSPEARALAMILAGQKSSEALSALIDQHSDASKSDLSKGDLFKTVAYIRLLVRNFPNLDQTIFEVLQNTKGPLSQVWTWFAADNLGIWESVSNSDKVAVIAGLKPKVALVPAHLADLLTFPIPYVNAAAIVDLVASEQFKNQKGTINYLADNSTRITRAQLVSFVTALADQDEVRKESLIAGWFKTDPEVQFIAELLAVRAEIEDVDIFSLEAARYLKDKSWHTNLKMLELYTKHKELLVRALAYAKLNIANAEERKLIEAALKQETNERLKEQLKLKLEGG